MCRPQQELQASKHSSYSETESLRLLQVETSPSSTLQIRGSDVGGRLQTSLGSDEALCAGASKSCQLHIAPATQGLRAGSDVKA